MARTGRRLAQVLAAFAVAALLVACAEPDLTQGVPDTSATALAPTRVSEPARLADEEPPVPEPEVDIGAPPPARPGPEPPSNPEPPEGLDPLPPLPPEPAVSVEPSAEPDLPADPGPPAGSDSPADPEPTDPGPPADPEQLPPSGARFRGLDAETLRLAVIADVETGGVADDRSVSVHRAMLAWAEAVNAAGGLAGRRVELVLLDAGLFGHESVLAEACSGDVFALVGSDALLDDEGVELLASAECDLLDFPAQVHSPRRAGAPRTFQAVPISNDFVNVSALRWMAERLPVRIRSTATFFLDFPVTVIAAERTAEAARGLQFELIYEPSVSIADDFDSFVAEMAAAEVLHVLWDGDTHRLLDLLQSLQAADLAVGVNCGTACNSALFLEAAGAAAEGVLISSPYLPLREDVYSPELAAYREWLAVVDAEASADLQGVAAWAAGRLFEEAVRRAIGAGTPSEDPAALSPAAVAAAASGIVNWHGHGLHAPSNPGTGEPSPCRVVMGASNGELFRFYPANPGSFDCSPSNLFALEATAQLGLEPPTEPAAPPGGPAEPATDIPPEIDE